MLRMETANCEDFETALVEELRILKTGERRLQRLYPRLRSQPQLREYFLLELAEVRQRADRLNAVLNPTCIADLPESYAAPTLSPAA
jgi:hypothetical protein